MAEIQHGTVKVTFADNLAPPPEAGNLSPDEVRRIAKPPRGIGLVCESTADALEKAGTGFTAPGGVTPASLRLVGKRAEEMGCGRPNRRSRWSLPKATVAAIPGRGHDDRWPG